MASSYNNIHPVDEILTSLISEAVPSDSQLIANQIFENVKITERSGTFLLENSRNFMGSATGLDLERAPGASRASNGGFDRTSMTYLARPYGLDEKLAMEDIRDSQYPGSEEARAIRKVRRGMMLAKEKRAADLIFDTSSFSNDTCTNVMGGKVDAAGTDGLTGLDKLKDLLFIAAHGINPDTLIFGRGVFRSLARNPEVRGYAGDFAGAGVASGNRILTEEATKEVLRNILGIPNIYVGEARRELAVPGATSNEAQIWNTETIFCGIMKGSEAIIHSNGAKGMPVAALNFELEAMTAGQYDPPGGLNRVVHADETHIFKAIDSTLGYILTDCLV